MITNEMYINVNIYICFSFCAHPYCCKKEKKMSHSNTQEIHGYLGILLWQRVVFQVHICESLIWILIFITPMSTQFHIQNTLKIPFRENLDKQWRNI